MRRRQLPANATLTERQWLDLHELDERIVKRCEDVGYIYRSGTEAEYETALSNVLLLLVSRPSFDHDKP